MATHRAALSLSVHVPTFSGNKIPFDLKQEQKIHE